MADIATIVETYIAAWNEPDGGERRELIAQTFTDDATYLDPLMSGEGAEGLDQMIAGAQAAYPGHRFTLKNGPDQHHDRVRFSWLLHGADGPVAGGTDFAVVADDGRLEAVTGFLDAV